MIYIIYIGFFAFVTVVLFGHTVASSLAATSVLLLLLGGISIVTLVGARLFSISIGFFEGIKSSMLSSIYLGVAAKVCMQIVAIANPIVAMSCFVPLAILSLFLGHVHASSISNAQSLVLALANLLIFPLVSKGLGYGVGQLFFP